MSSIDNIKEPVKNEMIEFENHFRDSMKSNVPLLDKITHYIVKRKGKQIRPLFVFLTAKMFGEINSSTYTAASLIELLHTATLVHDDVVDDSNRRRGFFSVNALWKNKIAVLVGDYLLSRGLLLSVDNNEHTLLRIVSNAVKEVSEGELLQIEKARKLDIEENIYYEIIRQKTASLIAACCACGAYSTSKSDEVQKNMNRFGELTGIAFQIKDDLFDFGDGSDIGKPTGIDIKEKKMTLPLIHALNNTNEKEKRKIIYIIKNQNNDLAKVNYVLDFVRNSDGIAYAKSKMEEYSAQAISLLNLYPESSSKSSLINLVKYTIERKH